MNPKSLPAALVAGMVFGFGLAWSTMVRPEVVIDFLLQRDLGLLLVLGGAVVVTLVIFQLAPRVMPRPVLEPDFETHQSAMNVRTLGGAASPYRRYVALRFAAGCTDAGWRLMPGPA